MSQKIQKKYKFAVIATDTIIFTIKDGKLSVLLIEVKKAPFTGMWAAPGGLVRPNKSVDACAKRILKEKSGLDISYLEQLYTFGRVNRDPFGRVVSVAYFALIPSSVVNLKTTAEYEDIAWFPIDELPQTAYDHREIIKFAIDRLRAKLEYTNIVYGLLPKEFTLTDLQNYYEIILNKKMDKRNFRKKILSLKMIKGTGKMDLGRANRPAELYKFIKRTPEIVQIL